jgi:predicted carbohydrate-binding protein with CBM48
MMIDNGERESVDDDAMPSVVASAVAALAPPPTPSPETVEAIMRAVRVRRTSRRRRTTVTWGAIAATLLIATLRLGKDAPASDTTTRGVAAERVVQFRAVAAHARALAVVGDFNSWDAGANPMSRDSVTHTWVARISLPEGRYLYAFVADGTRWFTDPNAPLAPEDDFSRRNSVLVVNSYIASRTSQ